MDNGKKPMLKIGIIEKHNKIENLDLLIELNHENQISEELSAVCFIILAQLLGFHKSIHSNFSPDSPSKSGAISRVVQGVTIYEKHINACVK
jgi:tagatose-6-phosphate ketose/aldose isomerase